MSSVNVTSLGALRYHWAFNGWVTGTWLSKGKVYNMEDFELRSNSLSDRVIRDRGSTGRSSASVWSPPTTTHAPGRHTNEAPILSYRCNAQPDCDNTHLLDVDPCYINGASDMAADTNAYAVVLRQHIDPQPRKWGVQSLHVSMAYGSATTPPSLVKYWGPASYGHNFDVQCRWISLITVHGLIMLRTGRSEVHTLAEENRHLVKLDLCLTEHHRLGKVIQMNQLDATMIYWSIRSAQHVSGNILPIIRSVRLRYLQHMVSCCCGG